MADLLRSKYYESPSSYEKGYTADFNAGMENAVKSGYVHPIPNIDDTTESCNPTCHNRVWIAYNLLVKALHNDESTITDLGAAMEEAIGYLGEALA